MTDMGYQFELFYGSAGSQAGTRVANSRDIKYAFGPVMDDVTVRGSGSLPIKESEPVALELKDLSFNMLKKDGDTVLVALLGAAAAGTPLALRTKNTSTGKGFDGDVYLEVDEGAPLAGVQTFDFKVSGINQKLRPVSFDT